MPSQNLYAISIEYINQWRGDSFLNAKKWTVREGILEMVRGQRSGVRGQELEVAQTVREGVLEMVRGQRTGA